MAVYTKVSDDELIAFIKQYDIGEIISIKGIAEGVENTNYMLTTTKDRYILTIYEKRVNEDDLPFFLNYMQYLADNGIKCPLPIKGNDGKALRQLCGRPSALISFLDGISPRTIKPYHCQELGEGLAKFHLAGEGFNMLRVNNLSLDSWQILYDSCDGRADEIQMGLGAIIETELDFLQNNWPSNLPQGICHADMFQDNVFFIGKKLSGIIDFYFACNDYFAYDIAICMNAWCFERDRSFNITKAKLLLANYNKIRPLSDAEIAAIPIFARGSAIRFLLTRLYDWLNHPKDSLGKAKDPLEYLSYLKFHSQVKSAKDYGL